MTLSLFAMISPNAVTLLLIAIITLGVLGGLVSWVCSRKGLLLPNGEFWAKAASEVVQWLSGSVAAWGTYQVGAADKPAWWAPVVAALTSLLVWKIVQHGIDHLGKRTAKSLREELERADKEGRTRTRLVTTLGEYVREKTMSVINQLDRIGPVRRTINHAREALIPLPHLESLLNSLAGLLMEQAMTRGEANPAFRLGVYVADSGVMRPVYAIETRQPGYNPFTSH